VNSQIQTAFVVASIAIGCAIQPLAGHDPSAGRLGGRNPLGALNEVVRSREQRKLDGQCFIRLTQTAKTEHSDGCSGPVKL
jgi:hypothetical protein